MRDVQMYAGSASPFDYLLFFDEKPLLVGIECKMLRSRKGGNPKSFPFSMVSEDQEEGITEINDLKHGVGLVAINFRWLNRTKGRVFILTADEYFKLKENFAKGKYDYRNTKSIPLQFLKDNCHQIGRKGKGWDLDKLIKEG